LRDAGFYDKASSSRQPSVLILACQSGRKKAPHSRGFLAYWRSAAFDRLAVDRAVLSMMLYSLPSVST
jgi:hypothetical protein